MTETKTRDIEWNSAIVPQGVSFIHYECPECGWEVITSPRHKTRSMPTLYCTCEEHGPPLRKTKMDFGSEVVER